MGSHRGTRLLGTLACAWLALAPGAPRAQPPRHAPDPKKNSGTSTFRNFEPEMLPNGDIVVPHQDYELLEVEIQHDTRGGPLELGRGDGANLLHLKGGGWVSVSVGFNSTSLNILDADAKDGEEPPREAWHLDFAPKAPAQLTVRCADGDAAFDFTDIPLQGFDFFGQRGGVRVEFGRPSTAQLTNCKISVPGGRLTLRGLLNARPHLVSLTIQGAKCNVDLTGEPFVGTADVYFSGSPASLHVTLPRSVGVHVEGAGSTVARFSAPHLESRGTALESRGYDSSPCRLRLHFPSEPSFCEVTWQGAVPPPGELPLAASPGASATPPVPAASAFNSVERANSDFENKILVTMLLLDKGNVGQAEGMLSELRAVRQADPRLGILERWVRSAQARTTDISHSAPIGEAAAHLQAGLEAYLVGQYQQALLEFRAAAGRDPQLDAAQAWIRKTQSEMQRLALADAGANTPRVVEKIVTQTSAPMFAVRTPSAPLVHLRSREVRLEGQVGDDQGIDRIEVSLNGAAVTDASGAKLALRPPSGGDARRTPFSASVPLHPGENEIVLTAYDVDSPPHRTSERFSVFRDPPLYRTAAFGVSLGALVLLGLGAWLISQWMKYRIAIVNKYNPYIAGSPIRHTEMLFGREALLRTILNTIQNNSIMLYGPRRIGKTSLQYELKRRLEELKDPEYVYIPAMIDLQGTSEEHFFATVMGDILDACKPVVGDKLVAELRERKNPHEPYSVRDFSRDLKTVLDVAQAKSERKLKLVLLIDEVDELNKYSEQTNQKLRSVFMKTFAEKMVAVMSGVHIKKNWESEGSPWYNFFEEIEIPPLVRDDAVRLIRKPVHGIFTYEEAAVEKILEYSECKPYLVQRLCVNAVNQAIDAKRRRITVQDVDAAHALIIKFVEEAA